MGFLKQLNNQTVQIVSIIPRSMKIFPVAESSQFKTNSCLSMKISPMVTIPQIKIEGKFLTDQTPTQEFPGHFKTHLGMLNFSNYLKKEILSNLSTQSRHL